MSHLTNVNYSTLHKDLQQKLKKGKFSRFFVKVFIYIL